VSPEPVLKTKITGSNRSDKLFGGGGADELYGLGGKDELEGGDGNDYLLGSNGKDQLTGDEGNDIFDEIDVGDDNVKDLSDDHLAFTHGGDEGEVYMYEETE